MNTMEHATSEKVELSSPEMPGSTIVDDGMDDEIRKMLMEISGPSPCGRRNLTLKYGKPVSRK
jgi:hypothetical protein